MERFYAWRHLKHCTEQGSIEALVICYKICPLTIGNVYSDVEQALKGEPNLPDCVYILGNAAQYASYQSAWDTPSLLRQTMVNRGTKRGLDFVKQYVFLEWRDTFFEAHSLSACDTYEFDLKQIMSRGVYALMEKNNAIHQAPSGHVFKHPSQRRNKVFIQAREIAAGEAELYVVAYTIALRHAAVLKDCSKVFIDTMGIYPFVKCALRLCGSEAEIVSFHSYDELEKITPPRLPYFSVVSASTSGSMAASMADSWSDADRIATIVDITAQGRCGDIMVALDELGAEFPDLNVSDGTLIEIIGENFSSKAKPPRAVVIGRPHAPKSLEQFHRHFGFSIHPFNSPIAGRTKLLQLDVTPVLEDPKFLEWLHAEIDWSFPLTVSHVIHADDEASQSLASLIVGRLSTRLASGSEIDLISYSKLDKELCQAATGVVVVSTVSRDGGVLREISRDLRSYIKATIPRHFISPIGIPETSGSWNQLRIFLTNNPTSREYGFSNWIQLPLGDDTNDNSWSRLITIASAYQDKTVASLGLDALADTTSAIDSLELAMNELSDAYQRFLHSPRGRPLCLSEGFLFFKEGSSIAGRYADVQQSMLYLTVSAVLQCAREHKEHARRLIPTGYESVVLAPECFLRFNDPVLQACLLRASHPAELDYSSSPELSKLMREFLTKVFARSDKEFGDAALEFAASIALGSLRLARCDMEPLLNQAINKEAGRPSILMGMLILAKQANR